MIKRWFYVTVAAILIGSVAHGAEVVSSGQVSTMVFDQSTGAELPAIGLVTHRCGCDNGSTCDSCAPQCKACSKCGCGVSAPAGCGCVACGCAKKAAKPNPCATSHKGVFYANDFSYLKDPAYQGCCLGDSLKLLPVGECGQWGTLDIGGQMRLRYHHEVGMGQNPGTTRFQNTSNDFLLSRLRLYTNWQLSDNLRVYVEGIYAGLGAAQDDYIPRTIDENYGDLLNCFVDAKLTDSTTARIGRQELIYGNQRLVSPLDWANTRRTFEGVKLMYKNDDWAVDGFYTHFVPVRPNAFDEADYGQAFYGMYGVYNGLENATLDLYYLGYDNQNVGTPFVTDFSLHTFGARLNGSIDDWMYELEGAPQFGRQSGFGLDQNAAFVTAGLGRKLKQMPWDATLWVYYDYASGNNIGGSYNRFNHLFPLGHRYLGFIDAVARENIESPNVQLSLNPTAKLNLLLWYYHFMSNQDTDIVPAIGGTPAQSTASKDYGDELDILLTYKIRPRVEGQLGWSHLWAGNKIVTANQRDADFFYAQWLVNF